MEPIERDYVRVMAERDQYRAEAKRLREALEDPEVQYMLRWMAEGTVSTRRKKAYERLRAAIAAPAADASASDALAASPEACAREGCGRSLADHYTAEPFALDCPGYQPATASAAQEDDQ